MSLIVEAYQALIVQTNVSSSSFYFISVPVGSNIEDGSIEVNHEEGNNDDMYIRDVFHDPVDAGESEAIQQSEQEAVEDASQHAEEVTEVTESAYVAEFLQMPSTRSNTTQVSATESARETGKLERVTQQFFHFVIQSKN